MSLATKVHAYYLMDDTDPLPCVLCKEMPKPGDAVIETNYGEPTLVCASCASDAWLCVFDLEITTTSYPQEFKP